MKKALFFCFTFCILALNSLCGQDATIDPDQPLNESNLDGRTLTLVLYTDTFKDASLDKTLFSLNNNPTGLSISAVSHDTDTSAIITLAFTGADFDSDINNFSLSVSGSELKSGSSLTTDPIPIAAILEPRATIGNGGGVCAGSSRSLTINFEYSSSVSYTFRYTRNGSFVAEITTSDDPYLLSVSEAGTYALSYLYADGMEGETYGSATVTVNPLPTPDIYGGSTGICPYIDPETYSTSYNSGRTWLWEVSGGYLDGSATGNTADVVWTSPGTRSIQVTETIASTGCSASDVQSVTVKDFPQPPTISGDQEFCDGSSSVLTATASESVNSYRWSTGASGQNLTVYSTGDYSAKVRSSATNCWSLFSGDYHITENPLPQAYLSLNKTSVCEGESAVLTVTFTQGSEPYNIQYTENGMTQTLTNLTGSSYDITVTPLSTTTYKLTSISDNNGCSGSKVGSDPQLTVNPKPVISFNPSPTEFLNTADPVQFTASATPTGGTGIFSGSSPAIASSGWFTPANAVIGTNTVTYTYTTTAGCSDNKSVDIMVFKAAGEIVAPGAYDNGVDHYVYCFDAGIDTILGNAFNAAPGAPTVFSGPGISDIGNNKAVFNPAAAGAGNHQIVYTYFVQYFPDIPIAAEITAGFVVDNLGSVDFSGIDNAYCVNNDSVLLQVAGTILNDGSPGFEGGSVFTGPGVSGPYSDQYYFDPAEAGTGTKKITYTYTRSFSQCKLIREKNLVVNALPQLNFDVSSHCILTGTEPDSIRFINLSPSAPGILAWNWNFGDPISGTKNTSTLKDPWHDYNSTGSKIIRLTGTDNNGCVNEFFKSVDFGEKSIALFAWEKECFGDSVELDADTDGGRVLSFRWDFGDGDIYPDTTTFSPKHRYDAPGNYPVTLRIINDYGCFDTLVQTVPIRPTIQVSLDNPYFEDFENGDGGWVSGAEILSAGLNSWAMDLPQGTVITDPAAGKVWVTNPAGFYQNSEKSFVEGPCFDFTQVEKPMIRLIYWSHTENTRDGAVLQSSINDGNTWEVVGSNLDGVNWYNSALLTGEPGGQRLGWTGTQQNWKEARNLLDHLKGEKVRLRISFGSDAVASDFEGFAFDNVWIGERTRMVLLEHFTNDNVAASQDAEEDISLVTRGNPTEVIDIRYHTGFPQADPEFTYYTAGPSSRTLYYGVSSIPYSVMDGAFTYSGFDGGNNYTWNQSVLSRQVLIDPLVSLDLESSGVHDNQLDASVKVAALDNGVMLENLTLQIAVTENLQSGMECVLRKMLPDPGGTSLLGLWGTDDTARVNLNWSFNPADFSHPDSLAMIAFVQRESDKSIMQAAYRRFRDLGSGTGIQPFPAKDFEFSLFPNPTGGLTRLAFGTKSASAVQVQVFNEMGTLLDEWRIPPGTQYLEADFSGLPAGLYLIRVMSGDGKNSVKKLAVSR